MKDSGIEWIKEIPAEWSVARGKSILKLQKRSPESYEEVITCFRDGEVTQRKNRREDGFTFSDKEIGYQGIHTGDLVIHGMDGFAGAIGISDSDGKGSPVLVVCTSEQNQRYLMYYLRMLATQNVFVALATGIRERSCDLRWNKIAELLFPIPPMDVQDKITAFLDNKCSKVDGVIARQQEAIEKLKVYKLSVITEAVTKGLNPDVPMKDSGYDFIGNIPASWNVCRLRNIGLPQNGISKGGECFGHGFPFVSYGDVYKNYALPKQVTGLVESSSEEQEKYSVQQGDIFFTRTSETIEEVGFSCVCEETIPNATFAGFLIRVRPFTDDLLIGFSKYYFRSNHHRLYLVKQMNLVTRASLGQDLLKSMPVLIPPKEEQQEITCYLDKKCDAIERAILHKQSVIDNLILYKKSLIYEVVTGKQEV